MDEEDTRSGPAARQSGRPAAPNRVPKLSLQSPLPIAPEIVNRFNPPNSNRQQSSRRHSSPRFFSGAGRPQASAPPQVAAGVRPPQVAKPF